MSAEIGHFALIVAAILAFGQSIFPMAGAVRRHGALMSLGGTLATGQFVFVLIAFGALTWAFLTSDFSVANVVQNSHSGKPLLYKISGVWGNHEGSMVLWCLILSLFGACVAWFGGNVAPGLRARAIAVQGMIGLAFLAFILLTSNPFDRVNPMPPDGRGLNPILQDPGLAFHPPLLYLGYVGFSVTFSFAVAALLEGRVDAAWGRWVRPWALAAWSFLTLGIALGSWWAYYELGWGGFWFWDPVENASFMPWLVGTALLHSAIVAEKRDALKSWSILLAILTFSLSLLGTFLVRSGVLTSVHTFATDPERGLFILAILAVAIGGALLLYAWRAPTLKGGGLFRPVSREGALILNNLLLTVAALTVLFGTLYPLIVDALGLGKISVGPPYFNATFVPLMAPLILAMGIAPFLPWKRADLAAAFDRIKLVAGVAIVLAAAVVFLEDRHSFAAALGMGLAAWLVGAAGWEIAVRVRLFSAPPGESLRRAAAMPRSAWGMTIAHAAAGVVVAGITASGVWQTEAIRTMKPGDRAEVASYTIEFAGVREVRAGNYLARRGHFIVSEGGVAVDTLSPEKRVYLPQRTPTTEAAIRTTLFADLYIVLGDPDGRGGHAVRLYHNPLVPWIWIGAVFMFLGGMISLTDRRHRVGAPRRSVRPAAARSAET